MPSFEVWFRDDLAAYLMGSDPLDELCDSVPENANPAGRGDLLCDTPAVCAEEPGADDWMQLGVIYQDPRRADGRCAARHRRGSQTQPVSAHWCWPRRA